MEKFKRGDRCVLRKGDDAIIYTVKEIFDDLVSLTYKSGTRTLSGGDPIPICLLMLPNKISRAPEAVSFPGNLVREAIDKSGSASASKGVRLPSFEGRPNLHGENENDIHT